MSSLLNATTDSGCPPRSARCAAPLSILGAQERRPAAKRAVKVIREGVKILGRQPGMGRPAQDMEPEYREWMIDFGDSGYIALYRYDGRTAVILAVRHQRELDY